ncbi:MAG: hypothetical protein KH454_05740, partial [Eggerthella sp.]|nr:hypothetical protein [Eggerthella sp.]
MNKQQFFTLLLLRKKRSAALSNGATSPYLSFKCGGQRSFPEGDKLPGRFQAVNAPYAALAKSSEKASAGFLHPSVCLG